MKSNTFVELSLIGLLTGQLLACGGTTNSSQPNASSVSTATSISSEVVTSSSLSSSSSNTSVSSSSIQASSSSAQSSAFAKNNPPTARTDLLILAENQVLDFDYLTANDDDSDGDTLEITAVSQPSQGTIRKIALNTYEYTPNNNYVGEDNFTYTVTDGKGGQAQAQVTVAINAAVDADSVRSTLMSGVNALSDSPTRGHMAAFGPTTVNLANYHDKHSTMAVAATLGAGRVVTLPGLHWASLDKLNSTNRADIDQFFQNSLTWLARSTNKDVRIVYTPHVTIGNWLDSNGYTQVTSTNNFTHLLANTDVLIAWLGGNPSDSTINAVTQFIQQGGSVFLVEFGDGFQGYTGWWDKTLPNCGGNRVLRKAGIVFGNAWNSTTVPLSTSNADALTENDLINVLKSPAQYTEAEKARISESLAYAFIALPEHDTLLARLDHYWAGLINTVTPTPSTPVTSAFEKSLLIREAQLLNQLPIEKITAHRTAEPVYGAIVDNAPRLSSENVTINGNWTGMLATGLYAPPGEVITISVPAELIGQGYFIRLSGHRDNIEGRDQWLRMPSGIQRSFEIVSQTTSVATPYGGAIYIDLLEGADGKSFRNYGELTITVDGAMAAPYFVLGETTNQDWVNSIRQFPAPYAELVADNLAVSVPSSMIRSLEDPQSLLTYWNDYMEFQDWVGATDTMRTGPDRINYDAQISVGYLHAGYPIQGPYGVEASIDFLNLTKLRDSGNWGYFHETGHEMQRQDHLWSGGSGGNGFTFSGDVEVTVNIFANAALERKAPLSPKSGWGWSIYHNEVLTRSKQTINNQSKPKFDDKDPYPFYFALADGFGWQAYRHVLYTYVNEARQGADTFPTTNQDKKDQWLIRWSEETGYNLVEYMVNRWQLEVSQTAINTVNAMNLPNWLPATTSIEHFKIAMNGEKQINLENTGITLDGTATFVHVIEGANHTLTTNGDGTYTYRPNAGFSGVDRFTVVYRSEAGNDVETTINVGVGI